MKKVLFFLLVLSSFTALSQVKITNSGNVGIGTTNPQKKLHIEGEGLLVSNTARWGRSFWVKVHNSGACAYHLWSIPKNRDVFAVYEDGFIFNTAGIYIDADTNSKRNIAVLTNSLELIRKLNGVTFTPKNSDEKNYGFLAKDLQTKVPELVKTMADSVKAVAYTNIIPINTEAIKANDARITVLEGTIKKLEERINILERQLSSKSSYSLIESYTEDEIDSVSNTNMNEGMLYQNTPNPFSVSTQINYTLPETFTSARIVIYDLQGSQKKFYNLGANTSSVTVQASELNAGMYLYSLFIDNVLIDTKRMVLTE